MRNIFGGQIEVACHILDWDLTWIESLKLSPTLVEEIELEIKRIAELEICKNKRNGLLELDIDDGCGKVFKLNGGWEIRY